MMVRILAHQSDPGNGIGLHYRRFQRYSDRPTWPNQLLAPARSRENRPYRPPIREDGLIALYRTRRAEPSDHPSNSNFRRDWITASFVGAGLSQALMLLN